MEHGTVIFVVAFLCGFIFLVGFIPYPLIANIVYSGQVLKRPEYPAGHWDISFIGYRGLSTYVQLNITESSTYIVQFGSDRDIQFTWDTDDFFFYHGHSHFLGTWWEKTDCYPITKTYILNLVENQVASFNVNCLAGDFQHMVQLSFDNITYADMLTAWNDGNLRILVGIRVDSNQTVAHYDAWSLIGQILTFDAPMIDPLFNYLIAIPIWTCIVIAIVYILDKILPF